MKIVPYKNREIDSSKPIDLYRCLNRKGYTFSLRQNGLVVGHTTDVVLKSCQFVVNKAGKEKCLRDKQRNVHAFIRGYLADIDNIKNSFSYSLQYNPYLDKGFYSDIVGEVNRADIVYFEDNKIKFQL